MSGLVTVGPRGPAFRSYLRLAAREWPWAPAVLLAAGLMDSRSMNLLLQEGEVLAGALLTARPANFFPRRNRRILARAYCARGLANLSYFAVRSDRRGQGHGQAFIRALAAQRPFWLACEPRLDTFYDACGLRVSGLDGRFRLTE